MHGELPLSLAFLAEFNSATALKLLFIALVSPLWLPIARAMRHEVQEALAPQGGWMGAQPPRAPERPPAGLDPFLNVPLADHRQSTQQTAASRRSTSKAPSHGARRGVLTPQANRRGPTGPPARRAATRRAPAASAKRRSF